MAADTTIAIIGAANGFFMNWGGNQKGAGIDFFLLLLGLAFVLIITGGGRASIDDRLSLHKHVFIFT